MRSNREHGRGAGRRAAGFTLIELVIAVAIVGIAAGLVAWGFGVQKGREALRGTALELRALLLHARQNALASGNRTVVMFFPSEIVDFKGARGRIILYEDGDFDFFSSAAAVNFESYDPRSTAAGPRSRVIDTMEFPRGVLFGPPDGWGAGAKANAPYADVRLDQTCEFCTGTDSRGAIVFEPLGDVSFYDRNGSPLPLTATALNLTAEEVRDGEVEVKTILIAGNGSMRSMFTARKVGP